MRCSGAWALALAAEDTWPAPGPSNGFNPTALEEVVWNGMKWNSTGRDEERTRPDLYIPDTPCVPYMPTLGWLGGQCRHLYGIHGVSGYDNTR